MARITVPMGECTLSFQIRYVVSSLLPIQTEGPSYSCFQLSKHALLLLALSL